MRYDLIRDRLGEKSGMLLVSGIMVVAIIFAPLIDRFLQKRRSQ